MVVDTHYTLSAADVADAVFSSMTLRKDIHVMADATDGDLATIDCLIASIDDGLKAAGLSFAEYLERIRHARGASTYEAGQRWRFSARERAVQRVDHAVTNLCRLMQSQPLDS